MGGQIVSTGGIHAMPLRHASATGHRTRRTKVAVEADRRIQERKATIGGQIRDMRHRRHWTQGELGERADLSRLMVGRAERGLGPIDAETLEHIAIAVNVPFALGFDRDLHDVTADAGHLAVQEIVLRHGREAGLARQFELPTKPNDPWRSIDVVLGAERDTWAICAECWNTFGDLGGAVRSSHRKLAELDALTTAAWGVDARASLIWVVRDTARNRALLGRYPEVFAATFTGSSRDWVAALTAGAPPPPEPGLVWCDTASGRLHAWHRSSGSRR